jgi:hypothetical protein
MLEHVTGDERWGCVIRGHRIEAQADVLRSARRISFFEAMAGVMEVRGGVRLAEMRVLVETMAEASARDGWGGRWAGKGGRCSFGLLLLGRYVRQLPTAQG